MNSWHTQAERPGHCRRGRPHLCSNGGDGVLQFQDTVTLSRKQWAELDKALASDCGARTAEGG